MPIRGSQPGPDLPLIGSVIPSPPVPERSPQGRGRLAAAALGGGAVLVVGILIGSRLAVGTEAGSSDAPAAATSATIVTSTTVASSPNSGSPTTRSSAPTRPTTPPGVTNRTSALVNACDGTTEILELGGTSVIDGGGMPDEIWAAKPLLCGEVSTIPFAVHGLVVQQEGAHLPDIWVGMEWNWERFPVSGSLMSQASPALAPREVPPFALLCTYPAIVMREQSEVHLLVGVVPSTVDRVEARDQNDLRYDLPLSDGSTTDGLRFFVVVARHWEREQLPERLVAYDSANNVVGRVVGGPGAYVLVPEGQLDGD